MSNIKWILLGRADRESLYVTRGENHLIELDLEITQMVELSEKNFKIALHTYLKEIVDKIGEQ